jgi:hypothetical protein
VSELKTTVENSVSGFQWCLGHVPEALALPTAAIMQKTDARSAAAVDVNSLETLGMRILRSSLQKVGE